MPDFIDEWLKTLSDSELDELLAWIDSTATYDEIGHWIDLNRPELAKKLFGIEGESK